jgi:NMT1-like family
LLKVILQQYGIDPAKVEIVQYPAAEIADAIKSQKADAYLAAGPVNSKITTDAIAASTHDGGTPTFLAIDTAEAIAQNHPDYEAADIPAGAFGGSPDRPDDAVKTISFSHHIVARKDLSDSTIAAFTRQLFAIRQSVMAEFPLAAKIETPDTDKDAAIPVHPGAAAFVDGEEKTFLDRYSDYIWWGLMGLSATGSAGAWFAGFLKKGQRNNNSTLRERLLDMLSAARQSDSTDELDRMQSEADGILRDTLQCFEHGAINEGALAAFNIALQQFHNAVADRKALLLSMPQSLQRSGAQLRATATL